MRKKIEMNLSKYPLNGVLIKGELADELTEIASIKENSIIEARQRMQEIDECAEKKFVQGYYDGYVKGIIDARGSVVSIIDELKRILLKSLENVEVFKSVFEQWLEKLPTTDSLVYLYVPSRYKEKFLYTESSCFTRLQKEIRIDYHEDNKFVFFTEQFIAEFCPHRSDVDFHRVLAEIPGNPIFMAIHVALLDWLIAARPTVTDQALHEHNNVSYQQHIAIVDAIRRHDPDEADRALQSHLNSVSATWHAFGQATNKKK